MLSTICRLQRHDTESRCEEQAQCVRQIESILHSTKFPFSIPVRCCDINVRSASIVAQEGIHHPCTDLDLDRVSLMLLLCNTLSRIPSTLFLAGASTHSCLLNHGTQFVDLFQLPRSAQNPCFGDARPRVWRLSLPTPPSTSRRWQRFCTQPHVLVRTCCVSLSPTTSVTTTTNMCTLSLSRCCRFYRS